MRQYVYVNWTAHICEVIQSCCLSWETNTPCICAPPIYRCILIEICHYCRMVPSAQFHAGGLASEEVKQTQSMHLNLISVLFLPTIYTVATIVHTHSHCLCIMYQFYSTNVHCINIMYVIYLYYNLYNVYCMHNCEYVL